ncbi:MAG: type III pantothenate kinase [Candidatus Omnitrophica bacterium]|nr:type III pantothenate kinase [Candidatus Omnitrophota bacterium]
MLLAIDIGNTNINLGVFDARRLILRRAFISLKRAQARHLGVIVKRYGVKEAIICSVAPEKTGLLREILNPRLPGSSYMVGRDIKVPLKNFYRRPAQVGQDRLVNAYAAIEFYGAPLIAIDFGTAITFDCVSRRKAYLGGLILPGLQASLDILSMRAALLPKVKLRRPREFIGRDTKSSMLAGAVYGFAASADILCQRIKDRLSSQAKVIGTGGNIRLISRYCRCLDVVDEDLTLKGLNLLYRLH